ncbi:hypothetical protein HLB35_09980 [Halomonas sp. TBZ9]|uniref:Lipid/polyisoprenoid-binding YceI-like domain-containing protein n=1 Tax=Vreelandella azerica TaxID=2732867 RepID=A0A7Y3TXQ9_9GAMM|nr:hypothetical protein [Halomonas azerica]NOG32004.1 hypothetical protein [Halomonas azerica]
MKGLFAVVFLPLALAVQADWQLDPQYSKLTASLTQNEGEAARTEQYEVRQLRGDISSEGVLRLPLSLDQTDVFTRLGNLPAWVRLLASQPLVTLEAQMAPERLDQLDLGESMIETLTFRIQTDLINQEEAIPLRFTREGLNDIRVTPAAPMALDGNALMANPTVRTLLALLGYQQLDPHVPVNLSARLINR